MDIIRKLSTDSESTSNNDNGSCNNDTSKEVQPTEVVRSCFAQVTCPPRIRGRQAFEDLLVQMMRDRDKELASLLGDHRVSNFKYRGRIQSTLRIRCYERCIAIQGRHRCRPSSAGSDLNRSGSGGVMHLLREKYKTSSENTEAGSSSGSASSRGRIPEKDPNKVTEKKVLKETMEKVELKEVIPVVEIAKKVVSSETAKNKNELKTGQTVQKETIRGRGEKQQVKEKTVVRESLEKQETKEIAVAKESLEGRGKKQEIKEKTVVKESLQGVSERRETKEKSEGKESLGGKGDKRDLTKEKSVEGNASMGIAEKVNLWKSEEKTYKRRGIDKNDVLEEATRRIVNVESAERRSITTSKEGVKQYEFAEAMRRKKKEDSVSVDANSKEIENRNTNPPQEVTTQVPKPASKDKVLKEKTTKSDLKKHVDEKESREGRGDRREMEEKVEENSLMGIAEKVNMWNSKERKNRRSVIEKGKGKTEAKTSTETSEVLQEASRRMIDVETAERSISTAKETVDKVVGNTKMMDQRESSREAMRCESEEKKGGRKQDVEDKSKEIIEVKNMNLQEVIPAEESKEISTSQRSEGMSILRIQEAKLSKETDRRNSQETIIEEDFASNGSKERAKEKDSSQEQEEISISRNPTKELEDEDTKKVELHEEKAEDVQERVIEFVNDWDENVTEEEENEYGDYDLYNGDYTDEWINEIARPQSHWEELRKERYLEVLNTEKQDICDLIHSQPVSMFLTSDLREKIDNMMITRVKNHLGVKIIQREEEEEEEEDVYEEQEEEEDANEEDGEECSARNQEGNDETEEEAEAEKTDLEEAGDGCNHSSARSSTLMKSWSFRDQDIDKDHEPSTSLSLPDPSSLSTNHSQSQDMQTVSDLREQMEKLQQEVLELRNSVKSCIDMQIHFQKFVTQDLSHSGSSREQQVETRRDPLKRKCCVCLEMPVDSLLYRCGHMCTCLKCAHELQWSSKKCPICMAPIVDVVRAFLDA